MPRLRRRARRRAPLLAAAACALLVPPALGAQDAPARTAEIFRRHAGRTLRVEVVERGSGAKATIGTAFHVDSSGLVVTNYHVISALVLHPERYRAEATRPGAEPQRLRLLAVDVVNDLAVLAAPEPARTWFTLGPVTVEKGERLFSLGHPRDLGLSIVEGTYNGQLEHSLYPRIHFTGSLNPGMSGGPAVTAAGQVVGVNVATEGDAISYLVPVAHAESLVARVRRPGYEPPADFLHEVTRQLHAHQEAYLAELFAGAGESTQIGPFSLPTRPAPFFRCWADADRRPERAWDVVTHRCSTDDAVFISGDQSSGVVELQHRVVTARGLGATQLAALLSDELAVDRSPLYADEGSTVFECETRNVRRDGRVLRAQLCLRAYRRLHGLYDAVLRAAPLGTTGTGAVTTLTLSGVSFANVQRLTTRYLAGISWRP